MDPFSESVIEGLEQHFYAEQDDGEPTIRDLDEEQASRMLLALAEIENQEARIQETFAAHCRRAEEWYDNESRKIGRLRDWIESKLQVYATVQLESGRWNGKKSQSLPYGKIGFRSHLTIQWPDPDHEFALIEEYDETAFVKIKKSLDKARIRKMIQAGKSFAGIPHDTEDRFFAKGETLP